MNIENKNRYGFLSTHTFSLLFIISLVFNYALRSSIFDTSLLFFNLLLLFIVTYLFFKNINNINISFLLIFVLILIVLISDKNAITGYVDFKSTFQKIMVLIFPLILSSLNQNKGESLKKVDIFLKYFNILMVSVFLLMLFDLFSNMAFFKEFSTIFKNFYPYYLKNLTTLARYPSILGHQLLTKTMFLIFYIFNIVHEKNSKKQFIITIISLSAITMTGSKTGIVLLVMLIVIQNIKNKNFFLFILLFSSALLFYYFGFFDSIIQRFTSTTLTTGRFEAWQEVKYLLPEKNFFTGSGSDFFIYLKYFFTDIVITASFEFPFLSLTYMYGILFTIIFYYFLFFRTIKKLFYINNKLYLIAYVVFMIDLNTYNQIIFNPDLVSIIVIFNYLFEIMIFNKEEII